MCVFVCVCVCVCVCERVCVFHTGVLASSRSCATTARPPRRMLKLPPLPSLQPHAL